MDPRLRAQLRIAEIDGMLEKLHVELAAYIGLNDPLGIAAELRADLLRMETDLRLERQRLTTNWSDMGNPREDPEAAYRAFMSMHVSEWAGLIHSLVEGGVLTPAEQIGFERALAERGLT